MLKWTNFKIIDKKIEIKFVCSVWKSFTSWGSGPKPGDNPMGMACPRLEPSGNEKKDYIQILISATKKNGVHGLLMVEREFKITIIWKFTVLKMVVR